MTRTQAALLAAEAVRIMERGSYFAPDGRRVEIGAQIEAAHAQTRAYPPQSSDSSRLSPRGTCAGRVEVRNETTFQGAKRLIEAGLNPLALNFASAKNPGGGFQNGARAQEESLCRDSALFACFAGQDYHRFHCEMGGGLYTSYALYSPAVPVFRDPSGFLLSEPWPLAILTCAAPNARALPDDAATKESILDAFVVRIRKVARLALEHEHDALVLGAWGCGAFGNDAREIAPIFRRVLEDEFPRAFECVVFSVLDPSPDQSMIAPFEAAFGS